MTEVRTRANVLLEEAARPSTQEIAATLRELGMGGYAADTFCALVRLPQATAGDLVLKTGIPDSKIYYALDELAEKGLIEVQAGKPKTYRAVPSREAEARLAKVLDAKHERERGAVKRVSALIEPLRAATKSPSTDLAFIDKDLQKSAELRSIVCSCMILVVDGQQVLTVTRTTEEGAYGITSTDETLVRLGMEYWQS